MTAEAAQMAAASQQEPAKAAASQQEPKTDAAEGAGAGASTVEVPVAVVASDESKPKAAADADKKEAEGGAGKEDASSGEARAKLGDKCGSFREESNCLADLKEPEKKALLELRALLEEAIVGNKMFKKESATAPATAKDEVMKNEGEVKTLDEVVEAVQEMVEEKGTNADDDKAEVKEVVVEVKPPTATENPTQAAAETKTDAASTVSADAAAPKSDVKPAVEEKEKPVAEVPSAKAPEDEQVPVDKDIALWGIPLLPSKNDDATNVILLKFLRAREFKPKDALEMISQTLHWRKTSAIDTILEDTTLGVGLDDAAYMDDSVDREGHPICYNVYGVFQDAELYQRTFGNEEKTEQFLRWRFQLMEKGIKKLDFRPGGIASILQVTDLKNAPGVSKKELRLAMKRAVALLQDNYPEFVARNIFVNVPFWYYAFNALLSPFLTQRTKSKFVFARPSRVTETLMRYIPAEEIPVRYGGLRRDGDEEFRGEDGIVKEVAIKSSSTETIELPAPEVGVTLLWDLTVLGWEVSYKEEFVPDDEGSYTVIVQKGRKMAATEGPVRNSFRNNEPGKIVLTIENNAFKRKKLLYRYKIKGGTNTTATLQPAATRSVSK